MLSAGNSVIAQFIREGMKSTFPRTDWQKSPCYEMSAIHLTYPVKLMSVPKQLSRVSINVVTIAEKLERSHFFDPAAIMWRKHWVSQIVERLLAFWGTFIFSHVSRCAVFSDSGSMSEFCLIKMLKRRLKSTIKHLVVVCEANSSSS